MQAQSQPTQASASQNSPQSQEMSPAISQSQLAAVQNASSPHIASPVIAQRVASSKSPHSGSPIALAAAVAEGANKPVNGAMNGFKMEDRKSTRLNSLKNSKMNPPV